MWIATALPHEAVTVTLQRPHNNKAPLAPETGARGAAQKNNGKVMAEDSKT